MILGLRFRCPKCGGYAFGTVGANGPKRDWIGHCHTIGCGFTWPRRDDWKCFVLTYKPETRAEYVPLHKKAYAYLNRETRRMKKRATPKEGGAK